MLPSSPIGMLWEKQTPWREIANREFWFLPAEMFQGLVQRCARNFDPAVEWMVHFQNKKDRARDGQRTDKQNRDHGRIARREQAEAEMQRGQPEEQHHEKEHRKRALRLLDQKPASVQHVAADLLGLRL